MLEIWTESGKFDTSQRQTYQARLIPRKYVDRKNRDVHTQRDLPKWNETQNIENCITPEFRNTSILTHQERTKVELIKKDHKTT